MREGAADDFDYRAVCNLSVSWMSPSEAWYITDGLKLPKLYAWDLGILQATFELLTVLNVLIAFIVLKIRKGQW